MTRRPHEEHTMSTYAMHNHHHQARHGLAIRNGWSGGSASPPIAWCGYCKGYFIPDEQWVHRFYDTQAKKMEYQQRSGYLSPRDYAQWADNISRDRAHLLQMLEDAGMPEGPCTACHARTAA